MAEASKDTDQSMEDILQSIKRIIADEGDATPPPPPASDVLELTELLADDVAVPEPTAAPSAVEPLDLSTMSIDDIMNAPVSSLPQEPMITPPPVPTPAPAPAPIPTPAPTIAAPAATHHEEGLMSDATLSASVAALSALAHKPSPVHTSLSPVFRSGTTVEDLVLEALKPMLKEWIDDNLPALVKSLVEKEIRRLSGN